MMAARLKPVMGGGTKHEQRHVMRLLPNGDHHPPELEMPRSTDWAVN